MQKDCILLAVPSVARSMSSAKVVEYVWPTTRYRLNMVSLDDVVELEHLAAEVAGRGVHSYRA